MTNLSKERLVALLRETPSIKDLAARLKVSDQTIRNHMKKFSITPPYRRSKWYRHTVAAVAFLRSHGYESTHASYRDSCDLIVNGKRIEFKTSTYRGLWTFNIHRHGVLKEDGVDVYLLRLDKIPGSSAGVYLIIPAPLKRKAIHLTIRSLIGRWGKYANNFSALGKPTLQKTWWRRDRSSSQDEDGYPLPTAEHP